MSAEVHNASTYTNHGCRCRECRDDHAIKVRARRAVRRQLLLDGLAEVQHGTNSTYKNWACRCRPCTKAATKHDRDRRLADTAP